MFEHTTVLLEEAIDALDIKPDGVYVDCTMGGGGHTRAILKRLTAEGRLIAFDQDADAIAHVRNQLIDNSILTIVHDNFVRLEDRLAELGYTKVDGVLFDLGVSSYQLDNRERGFSYHGDSVLDMRMDRRQTTSAYELVNSLSEKKLSDIIYTYGEERWAKRISQFILEARKEKPIETTSELVEVIRNAIPASARRDGHPARKTFQALRIAVNEELSVVEDALHQAINILAPCGRVCVISFHSLEDRIVKRVFKKYAKGCTCPPDLPVCVCGKSPVVSLPGHQPILPSENEQKTNPRSRSAKMRVARKLDCSNQYKG